MALVSLFSLLPTPVGEVRDVDAALQDPQKGYWKLVLILQSIPQWVYHKSKKEIVHQVRLVVPSVYFSFICSIS